MRHVNNAKDSLNSGDSHEALDILENLLQLAPRNQEALRLKAQILDAHGRFDESLLVLRDLARLDGISDMALMELEKRSFEEREVGVYSELTPEGRWYFSFSALQVWISLYGFLGCAAFLALSPGLLGNQGAGSLWDLVVAFVFCVVFPWILLMGVHMVGIKKILVGLSELRICTRFGARTIAWDSVDAAVMVYSSDVRKGDLFLVLYGKAQGAASPGRERKELARLNVSQRRGVVRARRHFVRSVLSHIDAVSYVSLEASAHAVREDPLADKASVG